MISIFYIVCGASLVFFVIFLVACSTPRRALPTAPTVHKLPQFESVESVAQRRFLVHLEKEIAESFAQQPHSTRRAAS